LASLHSTVTVDLGPRSYAIEIGPGRLAHVGSFVAQRCRLTHAVVITDRNVEDPYAQQVAEELANAGSGVDILVVESGEESKSVSTAADLWQKLIDVAADRKSVVVAVGGGVIGDLAGFVAATFARGLPFFQIPTTLLAQVDSSVGGKVGINLPAAKNMVGAFWQPLGVVIDTETLTTLPDREYRAGLAEVVKYGVIQDERFFEYLEQHVEQIKARQSDVLQAIIARCCRLKADVVEGDEREESGLRAILNYGHTFCHALETVTGYNQFLHGEAVSIGMLCASRLAERLGRITPRETERQQSLLMALGLPVTMPDVDRDALIDAMAHDKKVEHGQLRFVLPGRIGSVELVGNVAEADVQAAIDSSS
jgi:3-dehydroquinate synthase